MHIVTDYTVLVIKDLAMPVLVGVPCSAVIFDVEWHLISVLRQS